MKARGRPGQGNRNLLVMTLVVCIGLVWGLAVVITRSHEASAPVAVAATSRSSPAATALPERSKPVRSNKEVDLETAKSYLNAMGAACTASADAADNFRASYSKFLRDSTVSSKDSWRKEFARSIVNYDLALQRVDRLPAPPRSLAKCDVLLKKSAAENRLGLALFVKGLSTGKIQYWDEGVTHQDLGNKLAAEAAAEERSAVISTE